MKITTIKTLALLSFSLLYFPAMAQVKKAAKTTAVAQKIVPVKTSSPIINEVPVKLYDGLAPGSLAPDVVMIDADYIEGIMNGAVIIRKGTLSALIDVKGNYIVPYGKYSIRQFYYFMPVFVPLIAMEDPKTRLKGFINVNGEVVIPPVYDRIEEFDHTLTTAMVTPNNYHGNIDIKGNAVSPLLPHVWSKTMVDRALMGKKQSPLFRYVNQKVGYITRTGTTVIAPQFESGNNFVEGLAAVMKKDEFGEKKWGYIDETGKTVIPFMFKNEPGYFHDGLALVKPAGPATFDYAYIDKKGTVKLKIGEGKNNKYRPYTSPGIRGNLLEADSPMGGSFINGVSFWTNGLEPFLMDTLGNFRSFRSLIKGLAPTDKKYVFMDQYNEQGIFFGYGAPASPGANTGVMDYAGNILIPPAFNQVYLDYYSKYAHVTLENFYVKNKNHKYDGIVNPQGVFVMLVADKPTF